MITISSQLIKAESDETQPRFQPKIDDLAKNFSTILDDTKNKFIQKGISAGFDYAKDFFGMGTQKPPDNVENKKSGSSFIDDTKNDLVQRAKSMGFDFVKESLGMDTTTTTTTLKPPSNKAENLKMVPICLLMGLFSLLVIFSFN